MRKTSIVLLALVGIPVLGGLAMGKPEPTPKMVAAQAEQQERNNAEMLVRLTLRDPDSATFVHLKPGLCGYVNARNGFGGYTGLQRFIIADTGPVLEERVANPAAFDRTWQERCVQA